jgi:hypothetical protein
MHTDKHRWRVGWIVAVLATVASTSLAAEPVKLKIKKTDDNSIVVTAAGDKGDRHVLTQNARPNFRPYLHPIVDPGGSKASYTEDAPGHHKWQHGLYVGMHGVNGLSFWNNDDYFHPRPIKHFHAEGNGAGWVVETEWQGPKGGLQLVETQRWVLVVEENEYTLDLTWEAKAEQDVTFSRQEYGGLFLRMPWRPGMDKKEAYAENDDGVRNSAAEGKEANWVAVTMPIEGKEGNGTIVLMDHPLNPARPVPWRVDGQLGVSASRQRAGEWQLKTGETAVERHRILVASGKPDRQRIEEVYKDFAKSKLPKVGGN